MITEDELFRILLNSYSDLAELSPQLQQPNKDLSRVLSNKGRHSEDIQLEVQTFLLRHERTREWMESVDSDVIVVDARLYNASMPKISAASVFSASLITSLINASEDAVVVHYFCGIHFLPRDEFFGPSGLIRFITMQLLLSLVASQSVDLGFIDSKEFIRDLEDQELSRLCDLLYLIIDQFPEDITIWCVIDSIQRLDKPATSADLRFAMEFLHDLIDDTRLRPTVKVFMISLNHNKKTFTDLPIFQTDPSRIITLRPTGAKATRRLCDQAISDQLSRALPYRGSRRSAEY